MLRSCKVLERRAGRRLVTRAAALLALFYASPAEAQLVAPKVSELPAIVVPRDVDIPEGGRVEVVVAIDAAGLAHVEQCAASPALCALVSDAIAAAKFQPGTRDGVAIASRVHAALQVTTAPPAAVAAAPDTPASLAPPANGEPAESAPSAANSGNSELAFGAKAHVVPPQPGMRRLELVEMRDLPGAFGDPFRAIEALPGIVPVLSGLPYFFVRGSPPAGTLYIYDDIPVPTLYHLAVGPAVIHPRMVGPIRLYSGVAPARYGRLTGGVVVGEGPEAADGKTHAEAELRLLDVSSFVQTPLGGGTFTGAFRYGYPALLLTIFSPQVSLAYWDYQLRYARQLSTSDRMELVALGSYDSFSTADAKADGVTITFHRFEPRFIHQVGRTEYGVALLLGWEQSQLGSGFHLQATRIGPRMWVEQRLGVGERLRVSADMQGIAGYFSSPNPNTDIKSGSSGANSLFGDIPARSLWGIQAELVLRPSQLLELQLGARADAWVQEAAAEAVLDPRLRAIFHVRDDFDLHVAAGVVHQPAVFYLPLPGIADVATDRGLQTAIQSEAGVGWDTPLDFRAELQAFLHRYDNLVFVDALVLGDSLDMICSTIQCAAPHTPNRINGYSYGAELFLKRAATERVSGWISYTLAWSRVDRVASLPYTPTWDVRHVGNLVLQWNMGAGFSSGARWSIRSGKMHGDFLIDPTFRLARFEERLPWFTRLDLEVAYGWHPSWGRMRVSLEWFNATLSREPQDIVCAGSPRVCHTVYLPAIFFPNLGLRGEL